MARLCRLAVLRCRLDLSGVVVLTEAATGAYAVTAVLAALAGAERVLTVARDTSYGTVDESHAAVRTLALAAGVDPSLLVPSQRTPAAFAEADLITNSGHVRPIDAVVAATIRPESVIPLMFESWELQPERSDLDVAALAARGVRLAGTNERHPAVDVFSYLGPQAVVALADAGVPAYGATIAVLCDNAFAPFLERGLVSAGAQVRLSPRLEDLLWSVPGCDALIVAMTPGREPVVADAAVSLMAEAWPGVVVAQLWGDLDRSALNREGVSYWPPQAPAPGHMGVLPSRLGPDPVIRLQAGGLKVGEMLLRGSDPRDEFAELIDPFPT